MKLFLVLCALLACLSSISRAQSPDIEAIKKLNQDWLNSYPKRDSATLSRVLADDFIMISPTGLKQTKTDNLLNIMQPNIETMSVTFDSVEVRLLTPSVGVLTAWANFAFKVDGQKLTGKNCYQDVYMKRKGRWVAVAAHVTALR